MGTAYFIIEDGGRLAIHNFEQSPIQNASLQIIRCAAPSKEGCLYIDYESTN